MRADLTWPARVDFNSRISVQTYNENNSNSKISFTRYTVCMYVCMYVCKFLSTCMYACMYGV